MRKSISVIYLIVVALLLTSTVLKAEEDYETTSRIEGEYVEDSELKGVIGKGTDSYVPNMPDTLSVILWDEVGNGNKSTQHKSMTGSGNIQKVNMRVNRN